MDDRTVIKVDQEGLIALALVLACIAFHGEPDLVDAVIYWLMQ